MIFSENNGGYVFVRDNGEIVKLSSEELKYIDTVRREYRWRSMIREQIEEDEDNIDFSGEVDEDAFIELCLDEISCKYELYESYKENIEEIVFDVAHENDMWRV